MAERIKQFNNSLMSNRCVEAWRKTPKIPHISKEGGLWHYWTSLSLKKDKEADLFTESLNKRELERNG